MNKKYIVLLTYLNDQKKERTSKEIADALSISVRTVKSYVRDINNISDGLILSNRNGYIIQNKLASINLIDSEGDKDQYQNSEDRKKYILRLFLIEHLKEIDIDDLADELFVSSSTIKQDITEINNIFKTFNFRILTHKNMMVMDTNEEGAKKLYKHLILSENVNYISINSLKKTFYNIDVELLSIIIDDVFSTNQIFINDFVKENIMIHILIMFDMDNYEKYRGPRIELNDVERSIVNQFCREVKRRMDLNITDDQKAEIGFIIVSNIGNIFKKDKLDNLSYVGKDIKELVDFIILSVENKYAINLRNKTFMPLFTNHIDKMVARKRNNIQLINPMKTMIFRQNPFISDVAVYISLLIKEKMGIELDDDEICFIALHVGGEMELQKHHIDKIDCVIFSPSYLNIKNWLYDNVIRFYGAKINILAMTSDESRISSYNIDLCISSVEINKTKNYEVVVVAPFVNFALQKINFDRAFEIIEHKKRHKVIHKYLDKYCDDSIYFYNAGLNTKEKCIHESSKRMCELGYVDTNFESNVLIRDKAASTKFGKIAIPHSFEMDGLKTGLCIIVDSDGIRWGDEGNVNIIFLLSLSINDNEHFNELYEALINEFDDEQIINQVCKCNTYDKFKSLVFEQ